MRDLISAASLLISDLAATILFLLLFLMTGNVHLAVVAGMILGVAQLSWRHVHKLPIDAMQWLSLALVLGAGLATLLTADPRFVMLKPTAIYTIVGAVMLKPGWLNRYLPPVAVEVVPDIALIFGYLWSALMFASAALNIVVAMHTSVATWAAFMSAFGIASKAVLFLVTFATLRLVGRRRRRARDVAAAHAES